ncbi:MAG TPA: serine hydrolase, partial [Blastocatellia bacterium]|nr:serine hydrolase [Blastocatellia bacterium]
MRKQLLSLLITTIFLSTAILAQGANSAGHWEGSIDTPNGPLAISIDLAPGKDGKWAGEIGVPSQGLSGYPLSNVKVEGASVSFEMRGSPGVPAFNGKLSEDGKTISGEMKQGGTTMPFKIERK